MIPYGRQSIDDDDIEAVVQALKGDTLTGGPYVAQFEAELARAVEATQVVACANGTAALHLAMMALDIGPGDAVIVPSLTFLATANAAAFVGAEIRFADVDAESGLMTPPTLERALATNGPGVPKAVVPVHLNGQCVDMKVVGELARQHGLAVVEDASHAVGAGQTVNGRRFPIGSTMSSDIACFSFHPVKTITMGEGGAIATHRPELADKARRFRNHGMVRDPAHFEQKHEAFSGGLRVNPWYSEMPKPGFNYRVTDIQCALGISQLKKLEAFLERRRTLAGEYDRLLAPFAPLIRPVPRRAPQDDGWHLYPILIDFEALGTDRATVMSKLRERGVGSQVHYLPVHRQPYYRQRYPNTELPGADAYYARCLSLPLYPDLTLEQVRLVVEALQVSTRAST